jgi:hypothetical protein
MRCQWCFDDGSRTDGLEVYGDAVAIDDNKHEARCRRSHAALGCKGDLQERVAIVSVDGGLLG